MMTSFRSTFRLTALKIALFFCLLPVFTCLPAAALDKVSVQLSAHHNFQFAGYYAALEKGYYKEAGLDVTILEGGSATDAAKEVVEERTDFGVGTAHLLINRFRGQDVVVLAQIFQHSPTILLTTRKTEIRSVFGINGKRFMYSDLAGDIRALLKKHGIEENSYTTLPHSGNPYDLITGKTDIMTANSYNEPFVLEQAGETYLTFSPIAYDIDFYGDNIFTTQRLVKERPQFVRAFREATLRGWKYALDNKSEIVDLVRARYAPDMSTELLMYGANQIEKLILPNLIKPGYQNPARWQDITAAFTRLGMLPPGFDPKDINYDPDPPKKISITQISLTILIILMIVFFVVRNYRQRSTKTGRRRRRSKNKSKLHSDVKSDFASGRTSCD